ncbi:Bug family tripartite tricarboxylate transporter substrate binding protein [Pseudorhodoferax sp.]|uniref:Bug family tripartite tricarboxylate transporter substrate binding protein n=1 Tax=Pseudorhodoferax sp. TaxID=1993553 RepID=UPI002DD64AA3|nr:tripartite tricarboxylate transporter substrate binding protein [Pseudorhodoferax sp.]
MERRTWLRLAAGAPLATALSTSLLSAQAQGQALPQPRGWPQRNVRLIAPFAAGSTSDTSARFIAQHLGSALGHPVVVDNMPGADGRLGMMAAKNAPTDGHTLVLGSWTNLAVNAVLIKDLPYDPLVDFKPVAGIGRSMLGIAVSGQSDLRTLADLVAAARQRPRQLNFGNFATGYRLATEWFAGLAGIQFTHVPYRSTSQMNTDLAGRQIDVAMDGVTSMTPMLKSGQLRMLAVTGEQRHAEFPDVPTLKETYPEYAIYGWSAVMVRSEVSDEITQFLAQEMERVLGSPDGREFSRRAGSELLHRRTDAMRQYQMAQIDTLRRVAQAAGLKPE